MDIRDRIKRGVVIGDGAMGTMLQQRGAATGTAPERLNEEKPEWIRQIHTDYFSAGSDFVTTNTFGANRQKMEDAGLFVELAVTQAVTLAKEAAASFLDGKDRYVALGLGPIGQLMKPTGPLEFEDAVMLFKEQVTAGVSAGADLVLVETIADVYEMKAAVVAIREVTGCPIFCSLTFQEDQRTLMGTDPLTAVTILQDLPIDALGVNCSLGPEQMVPIVKEILAHSQIPVLVQPNAGLPVIRNRETFYDVDIHRFSDAMEEMLRAGVTVVGGCCGTTPAYIRALVQRVANLGDEWPGPPKNSPVFGVSSSRKTVRLDHRVRIIGERINPTGKSLLKEALKSKDYGFLENEAVAQVQAGAAILDVNVGLPGLDEKETMLAVLDRISAVTDVPLQIDSSNPEVLEAAVRRYNGKPIINSVSGKPEVMDAVFPIAKKYGANVVALTLDDAGLPKTAEERVAIAEAIIRAAESYGIGPHRILVDCLTLTVSAQQEAGKDTLKALREVKERFGVKTTLGISNVSFGLPERHLLNRTFLAMALEAGLDAPITDPLNADYRETIHAFEALAGMDPASGDYIARLGKTKKTEMKPSKSSPSELSLGEIIDQGYMDRAAAATEALLASKQPLEIVEEIIIPALEIVGRDYESGEKFLPQLVQAADTVQRSFEVLKRAMQATGETICYGRILLATVEGDIHDIGKNIVRVIFENYGYQVLDLGRDVKIETIVETVKKEKIKMVGLSALMTTTVFNMEKTIAAIRQIDPTCQIAVGGAVLTAEYAKTIGADYYCKDAMDGVRAAHVIFGKDEKHGTT